MQISVTVLGLIQLIRGKASTSLTTNMFEGSSTNPSSYALALYSGLWSFDGWDQGAWNSIISVVRGLILKTYMTANYVGGEMKNPEKNIPRTIHSSMLIVTVSLLAISTYCGQLTIACTGLISFGKCIIFRRPG